MIVFVKKSSLKFESKVLHTKESKRFKINIDNNTRNFLSVFTEGRD